MTGYFDGDTPADGTYTYRWTGTPGASTSEKVYIGTAAVDHADLQRRIDGGTWVTILAGITFPNGGPFTMIDTTPTVSGLNEYRALVTSISPSQATTDPVQVQATTRWMFLSYGDGFATILRARYNPAISETVSRDRAQQPLLGQRDPVALTGANRSRQVKVATMLLQGGSTDDTATVQEVRDAFAESDIVLYRDVTGRRIFGALSDLSVTDNVTLLDRQDVSFSVTEVRYTEGYLYEAP